MTILRSPTQRNHLIAEGRYHTGRLRARAPGILFETGFDALVGAGRTISREGLQKTPSVDSPTVTRRPNARLGPKKVSLARRPITGSRLFWLREGYCFPGCCLGKRGGKCRYHCRLGWCWEVHPREPLAPKDGCRTLPFCGTALWLVVLQTR